MQPKPARCWKQICKDRRNTSSVLFPYGFAPTVPQYAAHLTQYGTYVFDLADRRASVQSAMQFPFVSGLSMSPQGKNIREY